MYCSSRKLFVQKGKEERLKHFGLGNVKPLYEHSRSLSVFRSCILPPMFLNIVSSVLVVHERLVGQDQLIHRGKVPF